MFRFLLAHSKSSGVAPRPQIHRPLGNVMCIRGENVYSAFIQHALRPVLSALAEFPEQRSCGNLHPDSATEESQDFGIMRVDPGQTLRMRQNRHIASYCQIEKRINQSAWVNMMRGFNEHVPAIGEREKSSFPQPRQQIRDKMHVRTCDKI